MLSLQEKTYLLERLPEFELSYDSILHRKVYADVFVVIPKGKKALLWFTYWKGQNVCFVLTLNERGNICDVANYPVCFDSELSLSTLLYGTIFDVNGLKHFTCENVYYYKGYFTGHYNLRNKLALFRELFTYYIKQVAYTNNFLIIGLPIMKTNFQEALNVANDLPYQTYGIQMHILNKYKSEGIYINKQHAPHHEAYFIVKATLQNDIYELYTGGADASASGISRGAAHPLPPTKSATAYGVAMIPSYKSSVMMNSLFRTIKENANLDLLEESDDEEEFENRNENKFVDLDKTIIMKCVFLKRFRKWQPIEMITDKSKIKIITFKEVQLIEK